MNFQPPPSTWIIFLCHCFGVMMWLRPYQLQHLIRRGCAQKPCEDPSISHVTTPTIKHCLCKYHFKVTHEPDSNVNMIPSLSLLFISPLYVVKRLLISTLAFLYFHTCLLQLVQNKICARAYVKSTVLRVVCFIAYNVHVISRQGVCMCMKMSNDI